MRKSNITYEHSLQVDTTPSFNIVTRRIKPTTEEQDVQQVVSR